MAFCCRLFGNLKNPRICLLERNYCRDLDYSCHLWSCFCLPCPATPCHSLPHHTLPCHRLAWGASRHISRPSVEYKIYKYHTISHATLYNTTQRPSVEYKIYKAPPLQLSPVRMEDLQNSPFSCLPCLWSRIEDLQKLTHFGLFRIFLLFEQLLPLWQLSYSTYYSWLFVWVLNGNIKMSESQNTKSDFTKILYLWIFACGFQSATSHLVLQILTRPVVCLWVFVLLYLWISESALDHLAVQIFDRSLSFLCGG